MFSFCLNNESNLLLQRAHPDLTKEQNRFSFAFCPDFVRQSIFKMAAPQRATTMTNMSDCEVK